MGRFAKAGVLRAHGGSSGRAHVHLFAMPGAGLGRDPLRRPPPHLLGSHAERLQMGRRDDRAVYSVALLAINSNTL
jgi:hypothetical protein